MLNKFKLILILFLFTTPLHAASKCDIARISNKQIYYCISPGPKPIVVLESGLGNDLSSWPEAFINQINQYATIIAYNRMGNKNSYYYSKSKNKEIVLASQVAENLHDLLRELKIEKPVILVGHSLGGLYANYFTRRYPKQVAAVVLIDPASPDQTKNTPFKTKAKLTEGSLGERENRGIYPSELQIRRLPHFPPVPLLILVATDHQFPPEQPKLEAEWLALQKKGLRYSPKSDLIIANGSGHYIYLDEPQVVINAIIKSIQLSGAD